MVDIPSGLTTVLPERVSCLGGHQDPLAQIDGAKKVESLTQTEVG